MSSTAAYSDKSASDPYHTDASGQGGNRRRMATGHGEGGPASKRMTVAYGFWIFLLSDIVMFAAFFASYAVLVQNTAGGPTGRELFEMPRVVIQTALLLFSSTTCGLSTIATERGQMWRTQAWLLATGLLGAAFLLLEAQEFASMVSSGAGPSRSAFLSGFFALVGLHGLHIGVGLLWLGTMMAQAWVKGLRADIRRRLLCFGLFWHALDIVWVAIFTIVYIFGSRL
jgi:cytochrome o ubiquinol oxidase subunit 3